MPLIQIVDENDKPLRGGTMDEVQLQGLWHRIVRVMIEDPEGNILLQLRPPDSFYDGNRWDNSVSGHVDEGEDYVVAALRELGEETGLLRTENDLEELASWQTERIREGRTYRRFNRLYKLAVPHDTVFHPDPDEIAELRWFAPEEFKQLMEQHTDELTGGLQYVYEHFYTS